MHINFSQKTRWDKTTWKTLGIDGRIILEWILGEIQWEGVEWMNLAQVRDQSWTLVNVVMNLLVP
jgi:hypothetical protein